MSTPIVFPRGLLGVNVHDATIDPVDGVDVLWNLTTDDESGQWVCADPWVFKPDFELSLSEADRHIVGDDPTDLLTVVIVNATNPDRVTANYLAPLVINIVTRQAIQAVQTGSPWTVAEPLTAVKA